MDAGKIKQLIEDQKKDLLSGTLVKIKNAEVGKPMPMSDENLKQTHWFTPVFSGHKTAGFIIHNMNGKIIIHGLLTPNANDAGKIDAEFFSEPPEKILNKVKKSYPDFDIINYSFSYDNSPQKWAWRIKLSNQRKQVTLFVVPSGSYEKKQIKPGMEGG